MQTGVVKWLLALFLASASCLLVVDGAEPAAVAPTFTFPTLNTESPESANIAAMQYLLRHHEIKTQPITGVFDSLTTVNVKKFQKKVGVTESGTVDAATWAKLVPSIVRDKWNKPLKRVSAQALQYLLRHKYHCDITPDGQYGGKTASGVRAFNLKWGGVKEDKVGATTPEIWKKLLSVKSYSCAQAESGKHLVCDNDWLVSCNDGDAVWRQPCPNGCQEGACRAKTYKSGDLTYDNLKCCFPNVAKGNYYLSYLNAAIKAGGITKTGLRICAFMAQVALESGELKYWTEGDKWCAGYENSEKLGNTEAGDGCNFKGRGPIQLTGRKNYRDAGKAIGKDLLTDPKVVANRDVGFKTTVWFWNSRGLSTLADQSKFDSITFLVNGAFGHKYIRDDYYKKCKRCLRLTVATAGDVLDPPTIPPPADGPVENATWLPSVKSTVKKTLEASKKEAVEDDGSLVDEYSDSMESESEPSGSEMESDMESDAEGFSDMDLVSQ